MSQSILLRPLEAATKEKSVNKYCTSNKVHCVVSKLETLITDELLVIEIYENFSLWTGHHKLVHRNWKSNKTKESISDEQSVYPRTPVRRFKENPLGVNISLALYKIPYLQFQSSSTLSETFS